MAAPGEDSLDHFLDKVDELTSIVEGFKSEDKHEIDKSMTKADELIEHINKVKKLVNKGEEVESAPDEKDLPVTKTGFNRTCINKVTDVDAPGQDDVNYEGMDQAGFMQAMEADAKQRAAQRQQRQKVANDLKEKGNEYFKQGDYEQALDFYTQGLREVKDNTALYTNRAQTYIKLGKFPEAVIDCEWALKVFPNCMKAHIHMGRAHIGLKEYSEARDCFNKALTCDPTKKNLINDYLAEVDRKELADKHEEMAGDLLKGGKPEDVGLVEILSRVQKPDQLPCFYSGGLRILKGLLTDDAHRALFRMNGGLELLSSLHTLQRCFIASPRSLSGEELDMLTSAFEMYTDACRDNETCLEQFLQLEGLSGCCLRFLSISMKGQGRLLQHAIINCLFTMSELSQGRHCIVKHFDVPKLLSVLFTLIRTSKRTCSAAANLANNLALDKKFKSLLRDKMNDTVCPAFEQLVSNSETLDVLPRCITMVTNLTSDTVIRSSLMGRSSLWEACAQLLAEHSKKLHDDVSLNIVDSVLGLLLNLTVEGSDTERRFGAGLCATCADLLSASQESVRQRALGLASHILPHCPKAVKTFVDKGVTQQLLDWIPVEDVLGRSALKSLTAMTQTNEDTRTYIVNKKGLGRLVTLLKCKDEGAVGNAALCLSHCSQVPKACAALTKTDIVKDLLVLARDGRRPQVQQNCAILIAKLAYGDPKHLERLRELHGIEILHSCMKFVK